MLSAFRLRCAAAAVVAVAGLMLSGCTGGGTAPTRTPRPTPSATPLYPSEEAALAAVTEAYGRYVKVSNQVANAGWIDVTPLKAVEKGDAYEADRIAGERNRSKGLRTVGAVAFTVDKIQKVGEREVSAYICLEVEKARVIDSSGRDATSPNRLPVIPYVVRFQDTENGLLIVRSDPWSAASFC